MTLAQVASTPTHELDGARAAVVATRLAELMGVYARQPMRRIDRRLVGEVIDAAAAAGLAESIAARSDAPHPEDSTVHAFLDALLESPRPAEEIGNLVPILGYPALQEFVAASEVSLRRYAAAERPTPDDIARRVHFLATLIAILRGSFNEFGIRRWFERRHPALGNRAPGSVLGSGFEPDHGSADRVLRAALTLLG